MGQENSFSFLNSLCTEIDNINYNEKVMIIATSNQISNVDMALRRSGRLDKEIKLEIPQNKGIFLIFY